MIASAGTTWSSSGRCWTRCVWSRCVWSRCYWRSPTNALSLITSAKTAGASAGRKRLLRQRCARQQGNRENGRERAHDTSYLADQQHTPNHFNSPVKTLGHSKSFRADRVALRVYPSLAESIASFLSVQPFGTNHSLDRQSEACEMGSYNGVAQSNRIPVLIHMPPGSRYAPHATCNAGSPLTTRAHMQTSIHRRRRRMWRILLSDKRTDVESFRHRPSVTLELDELSGEGSSPRKSRAIGSVMVRPNR